jgi:PAS domain S-box-containing protein/diguanylate cyclase (GGDEF)-like protein
MDNQDNFLPINSFRVGLIGAMAALVAVYAPVWPLLVPCLLCAALAGAWLWWDSLRPGRGLRGPRSGMVPAVLDLSLVSFMVAITGNIGSFMIGAYYFLIAMGSLNKRLDGGRFALAGAAALLAALSLGAWAGWLPAVDILGPYRRPSLFDIGLTYALWLAVGVAVYWFFRWRSRREDDLVQAVRREKAASDLLAEQLETFLDQSPLSIVVTDAAGLVLQSNRKMAELSGWTAEELRGRNLRLLQSGKTSDETYAELWRTINSGRVWRGELLNRSKQGREYWESASISPIRAPDGTIGNFLAIKEDITERKRTEFLLQESEAKYRLISDNTSDVIWKLDLASRRFNFVSPSVVTMRGLSVEEALAEDFDAAFVPESAARLAARIEEGTAAALDDPRLRLRETLRQPCRDGRVIDVELSASFIRDERGRPVELLGIVREASGSAADRAPAAGDGDWRWEIDASGAFASCPPAFAAVFGRGGEELRGVGFVHALAATYPAVSAGDRTQLDKLERRLATAEAFADFALKVWIANRPRYWTVAGERRPGGGWILTGRDVTAAFARTEELEKQAYFDPITGLANLQSFRNTLSAHFASGPAAGGAGAPAEAAAASPERPAPALLTLLHVENLKQINSIFGHPVGDQVLAVLARRLRFFAAEADAFAARIDGSTLAAFIARTAVAPDDLALMVQNLREPIILNNETIEPSLRAGAALAASGVADAETLLQRAELALNVAKSQRLTALKYFDDAIAAKASRDHAIVYALETALEKREFRLLYQPQIDVASGAVRGAEALIRWSPAALGAVGPAEFIPIAEQNGHIISLGAWIQQQACRDALAWPDGWTVSINVAAAQLMNRNFCRSVGRILDSNGFPPGRFKIEITESSLIGDNSQARAQLDQLRSEGIRISLDDFGTGFSSLSYIKDFPIDELKIDQSFIRAMADSNQAVAIVDTVIRLARNLGLATTAEGVETADQAIILRRLGCDSIQGYLYSKPISQSDLLAFRSPDPFGSIDAAR